MDVFGRHGDHTDVGGLRRFVPSNTNTSMCVQPTARSRVTFSSDSLCGIVSCGDVDDDDELLSLLLLLLY